VSDDRDSPLAKVARRHAGKPQPLQPAVTRTTRFHGQFAHARWQSIAWAPDGSQLAFGGRTGKGAGVLEIWNGQSGHHEGHSARRLTDGVAGPVTALAWAPDCARLATVEENQWSGQPEVRVRGKAEGVRALAPLPNLVVSQVTWSPDGSLIALSGQGTGTVLVDSASGMVRRVLEGVSGPVAWEPRIRLIAGVDGTSVVLCDPATGERVRTLTGRQQHVPAAIAWTRHGKYLAVADGEDIRVWDAEAGESQWKLPWATSEGDRGPDGSVTSLEWLDGGHYLLEFRPRGGTERDERGTTSSSVILWDTETGKTVFNWRFYETTPQGRMPIAAIAATPDGRRMTHAIDGCAPVIWQVNSDLPHYLP
jgi:WD40 repeat protein